MALSQKTSTAHLYIEWMMGNSIICGVFENRCILTSSEGIWRCIVCRNNNRISYTFQYIYDEFRCITKLSLQWCHNMRDGGWNHQPHDCLLNCLFRHRSKKTSKIHVTLLWAGNSPQTGEFPIQMAINAENVSIWWRHRDNVCSLILWIMNIAPEQIHR